MSFRFLLRIICLVFLSCFSFQCQILAQKYAAKGMIVGWNVGNFFEPEFVNGFHNGSAPLVLGVEFYPAPKYGLSFMATGGYMHNAFNGATANVGIYDEVIRDCSIFGLRFASKFWLGDVKKRFANLGFETGMSLNGYRFEDIFYRSSPINVYKSFGYSHYVLTPVHFGVNVLLLKFIEFGIHYNLNPFLGGINNSIDQNDFNITLEVPQVRRSYLTANIKFNIVMIQ